MKKFNAEEQVKRVIDWAKDFLKDTGDKPIVIGISGGKDSTITAAALCKVVGPDRILGVRLPHGVQKDIDISRMVCANLGIDSIEVNIAGMYNYMLHEITQSDKRFSTGKYNDVVTSNAPCRCRTVVLYTIANQFHGRVVNTCNLSESFVGYDTKFGDQCGDFNLFQDYTATEVKEIGYVLGVNPNFIEKIPDDGMCGQYDEERWGFTYLYLDSWIRGGGKIETETDAKIVSMHQKALHKIKAVTLPHPKYYPAGSHTLLEEIVVR